MAPAMLSQILAWLVTTKDWELGVDGGNEAILSGETKQYLTQPRPWAGTKMNDLHSFLNLPPELRSSIYTYLFADIESQVVLATERPEYSLVSKTKHKRAPRKEQHLAVLPVDRQIHAEAYSTLVLKRLCLPSVRCVTVTSTQSADVAVIETDFWLVIMMRPVVGTEAVAAVFQRVSSSEKMVEGGDGAQPPTWKFTQCFGDKGDVEDITEADIISTVEFDQTGNYLATGDKGGRVVLFERNETKKTCEYKFHTEFQSHEPEFDYLKSLEIEEKINKIKWCRRQNASHYLLSTNDKTIKLWKVFEKSLKVVAENNLSSELTPAGTGNANGGGPVRYPNHAFRSVADLKFPRMTHHDTVVAAVPRRVYANAHAYHINSISVNSDGETFISSDDLRINLWNLNIQDQSFNIVDIKPANMEELTEVITAAEFHPMSCNWFMYASSKGTIKLADMRQKALCDEHAKQFEQEEDPSSRSFFSEIISSISDVRFSHDGRYILSRDYLTVKIWDVNMERQPVKTIPIHEHLRPRLCDTYENDSIFDKFEVVFSGDAKNVMTGSYNNNFMIYPSEPGNDTEVVLQADKSAFKAKKVGIPTPMSGGGASPTSKDGSTINKKGGAGSRAGSPAGGVQRMKETDADQIDFNKKILHMSWHPQEDSIAIAATNNLFVFSAL
ncbi:Protein phosphatase PP2A regulatory subunit B [Friedmanniomyces simplex]|uniref:Protein phosphatase PP2A regulatory subunit B n=1 Tax=Friedmanniomyces simplex TaxID=329884 RepID=A0A4V5NK42_9PEZI|nr:Protein phosphatase PP2A regulatory subunit B [Friedmanniomyces simplex]